MIKNLCKAAAVLATAVLLSGCATTYPLGIFYTKVSLPVSAPSGEIKYTKVAVSECKSFLAMFAYGDASIDMAIHNNNLTAVKYVDYKAFNILGIVGTYRTFVYGD
ncbi:MAG: hypothetical protein A2X49_09740 [Lentisphaerae bacterium GWF2_52_8]|nr:MAG: hypothetical protein A2X49_09740 [Lentisphaerae bacterium GWF2_52_8]